MSKVFALTHSRLRWNENDILSQCLLLRTDTKLLACWKSLTKKLCKHSERSETFTNIWELGVRRKFQPLNWVVNDDRKAYLQQLLRVTFQHSTVYSSDNPYRIFRPFSKSIVRCKSPRFRMVIIVYWTRLEKLKFKYGERTVWIRTDRATHRRRQW